MEKPLVSVVITSYKRERKYIEEAIGSVKNQTYENIEIIVVDDNGDEKKYSEELHNICSEYGATYFKNPQNMGAQFSRNIGILNSHGVYIAFLDDDDIWMPEKIERQIAFFSDPEVGMVFCDGYSFADGNIENKWEFREASIYDRPIGLRLELFNDYIGSTSQALIRKECFAKVGMFDCDMPARQDYEMWLRICRFYKVVGCPEKLLLYRFHPGERISTNWEKCFNSYRLVLEKHKQEYDSFSYAKSKIILRMFDWSVKGKKYFMAMKYFSYAFITNPRCVIDVIWRRISKQKFSDFYSEKYLKTIGLLNET